jgi:hypothetical protein
MRVTFYEPEGELTAELVSDALGLAGVGVTPEAAEPWTRFERLLAYDWAVREHLRASDNLVRRRERPSFLPSARRAEVPGG